MTEYELLALQAQRAANVFELGGILYAGFTIYLTIITAYLIAAYVAGNKLTRPQVFIATATYLFGASVIASTLGIAWGGIETVRLNMAQTWIEYGRPELAGRHDVAGVGLLSLSWWVVLVIGILAPLYFMWSVRHSKAE
jgi:hypothetical protein